MAYADLDSGFDEGGDGIGDEDGDAWGDEGDVEERISQGDLRTVQCMYLWLAFGWADSKIP